MAANYLVQEDGVSRISLGDVLGSILLDSSAPPPSGDGNVFHSPINSVGAMMNHSSCWLAFAIALTQLLP